jgi:RHS repeat-associated protein
VGGTITRYVYDGPDVLAILDASNNLLELFTQGPGINVPLIMRGNGQDYFFHQDALGSVVALTDSNGNVVETVEYEAFGRAVVQDTQGNVYRQSTVGNPLLYAGSESDLETGLNHMGHRYEGPETGSFLQEDPLASINTYVYADSAGELSVNLYEYAANDPMNRIDPLGLRWEYSQSTGQLWYVNDVTGQRTLVGKGFSGQGPGLNNPDEQNVRKEGPVPRGDWNIGPPYDSKKTGPVTMNLDPLPGTETFKRDKFRMHGGTKSEGCIIMDRNTRERVKRSRDRKLRAIR